MERPIAVWRTVYFPLESSLRWERTRWSEPTVGLENNQCSQDMMYSVSPRRLLQEEQRMRLRPQWPKSMLKQPLRVGQYTRQDVGQQRKQTRVGGMWYPQLDTAKSAAGADETRCERRSSTKSQRILKKDNKREHINQSPRLSPESVTQHRQTDRQTYM